LADSNALSIVKNSAKTSKGRTLAILMTDGADRALLGALRTTAKKAGADVQIIAPTIAGIVAADGSTVLAHHRLEARQGNHGFLPRQGRSDLHRRVARSKGGVNKSNERQQWFGRNHKQ
jgi:hypothetical protein